MWGGDIRENLIDGRMTLFKSSKVGFKAKNVLFLHVSDSLMLVMCYNLFLAVGIYHMSLA